MIYIPESINESDVEKCIVILTKLTPIEEITEDRYLLKLGTKNPLEIGYDKKRRLLSEEIMKYSALIRMLEEVCKMMKNDAEFIVWREENAT